MGQWPSCDNVKIFPGGWGHVHSKGAWEDAKKIPRQGKSLRLSPWFQVVYGNEAGIETYELWDINGGRRLTIAYL